MKELLDGLLPRLFPGLPFLCVPHEGKADLERSIPRKLRGWREPGVRFGVVRDNDGGDCRARKKALRGLCEAADRPDTLVRLACQELEAWYLGEPEALAEAFGRHALRDLVSYPSSAPHNSRHGPLVDFVPTGGKLSALAYATVIAVRCGPPLVDWPAARAGRFMSRLSRTAH